MEQFNQLVEEANKAFETADHLAYVTFPVVNDMKLLLGVAEQLHKAAKRAMEALLCYDAEYKRIPVMPLGFQQQYDIFKRVTARRYQIPRECMLLLEELQDILANRQSARLEFVKRDKFIFASESFKVRTLSLQKIKEYIQITKVFIEKLNGVKKSIDRRSL